jgi:NAD(P)H-hydrate epimerase
MSCGFLTRAQVRDLDRRAIEELGLPGAVLMENAGRGAAELLVSLGIHGQVVICCGKGNNGGDGFVVARHLRNRGCRVRVLLFARPDELTGDAGMNFHVLERADVLIEIGNLDTLEPRLAAAEWTVDALFGTGLAGPVRPPFDAIVETINRKARRVFALDIPSGLDADTGEPMGPTIRALHTATFAALKKGFANPKAARHLGQVHLIDIGIPVTLAQSMQDAP